MPTSYANVDTESLDFFFRQMRVFLTVFIFVFYIDAFFTQIISIVMKQKNETFYLIHLNNA